MDESFDQEENTEDETLEFLPFHALNEFMRNDYRLQVVRTALAALPRLSSELRQPVEELIRLLVRVPGFRNSAKAPLNPLVRPTAEIFEKSPEMVVSILAAWAASQAELRQKTFDLLVERGWQLLPVDADRSQLPGFGVIWPAGEDFDVLNQAFSSAYPDFKATTDDVSLMIVWLSVSLPYQVEEEDDDEEE